MTRPALEQVAECIREGQNRTQIAERFGYSPKTVDGWMRDARHRFPDIPQATRGRPSWK